MKHRSKPSELGQSLVFVALLLFVFIGMLALVLDGGHAYVQRRAAQNAADAGALAGASALCDGLAETDPYIAANEYVESNHAVTDDINVNAGSRTVEVRTHVTFQTFFASILGQPTMTAAGIAAAGCYSPTGGEGVMPVAWTCKDPVDLDGWYPNSDDCLEDGIDEDTLKEYLEEPDEVHPGLFIIMDDMDYEEDFPCIEYGGGGEIKCDFDDPPDGVPDITPSGGRSWLDLDGSEDENNCPKDDKTGEGANELEKWILGGYPCPMEVHTWMPEETGRNDKLFQAAEKRIEDGKNTVIVPVFDLICPVDHPDPSEGSGICEWHSGDDVMDVDGGTTYFHIRGFAAFYMTCVNKAVIDLDPNNKGKDKNADVCPGILRFAQINAENFSSSSLQVRSIEGYFLRGYVTGLYGKGDPGGLDTGIYTLYLSK